MYNLIFYEQGSLDFRLGLGSSIIREVNQWWILDRWWLGSIIVVIIVIFLDDETFTSNHWWPGDLPCSIGPRPTQWAWRPARKLAAGWRRIEGRVAVYEDAWPETGYPYQIQKLTRA